VALPWSYHLVAAYPSLKRLVVACIVDLGLTHSAQQPETSIPAGLTSTNRRSLAPSYSTIRPFQHHLESKPTTSLPPMHSLANSG
jgi:hypothetical protein